MIFTQNEEMELFQLIKILCFCSYFSEELESIANLCKKWNVVCVCDEVYEWMIFDNNIHTRMCTLPDMWERTITIGSAGKTFSVTGWKLGWAYGPADLLKYLQIVQRNPCATPLQVCSKTIVVQSAINTL